MLDISALMQSQQLFKQQESSSLAAEMISTDVFDAISKPKIMFSGTSSGTEPFSKYRNQECHPQREFTTSSPGRAVNGSTPLPSNFRPIDSDVIAGRGRGLYNKPGNQRFRSIVRYYVPVYSAAKTKVDKGAVIQSIIERVKSRQPNQDGGTSTTMFITFKNGRWYEMSEEKTREKVGHCIREAMSATVQQQRMGSTIASTTTSSAGPITGSICPSSRKHHRHNHNLKWKQARAPAEANEQQHEEYRTICNELLKVQQSIFRKLLQQHCSSLPHLEDGDDDDDEEEESPPPAAVTATATSNWDELERELMCSPFLED